MDNTLPEKNCPNCRVPVPAEAPQGLCPRCVMAGAMGGLVATTVADERRTPPSVEAVQAAFPQLEVVGLIGAGGMGFVYKARQPRLDRFVALKLLPESAARSPAFAERFNREARVLARLNHPNIVTVFDFGQAGGFFFLLMEFIDGVNLRQAMRAGKLQPAVAMGIVPKICEALQFAHAEGVLHRDIKPENILLDGRGRVKIADFGIAKLIDEDPNDVTLTVSGASLGTPHYMAPEQIERPGDVDHRADIYSLGVVFYEMLTGELPLGRFAVPSAKTELDARVDDIVLRALAKERELRQQSAGEIKTQVEQLSSAGAAPKPAGNVHGREAAAGIDAGTSSRAGAGAGAEAGPPPPAVSRGIPYWKAAHRPLVLIVLTVGLFLVGENALSRGAMVIGAALSAWRSGPLSGLVGLLLLAIPPGLAWWVWRMRTTLLEPLALGKPDDRCPPEELPAVRLLHRLALALILGIAVLAGLWLGGHLVTLVASIGALFVGNETGLALLLAAMVAGAVWVALREPNTEVTNEVTAGPRWMPAVGVAFVVLGALSMVPGLIGGQTFFQRVNPYPPSTAALVGLSLLTRANALRRLSLVGCAVFGAINAHALIWTMTHTVDLPPQSGLGSEALRVMPGLVVLAAGFWVLRRRDVMGAFGLVPVDGRSAAAPAGSGAARWVGVLAFGAVVASALLLMTNVSRLGQSPSVGVVPSLAVLFLPVAVLALVGTILGLVRVWRWRGRGYLDGMLPALTAVATWPVVLAGLVASRHLLLRNLGILDRGGERLFFMMCAGLAGLGAAVVVARWRRTARREVEAAPHLASTRMPGGTVQLAVALALVCYFAVAAGLGIRVAVATVQQAGAVPTLSVPADPASLTPSPIGSNGSRIGFIVPNGQVAVVVPVFWSNHVAFRLPNLAGHVIAPSVEPLHAVEASIEWLRSDPPAGQSGKAWAVTVGLARGGTARSGVILMPETFDVFTNSAIQTVRLNPDSTMSLWLVRTNVLGNGVSLEAECREFLPANGEVLVSERFGTGTNWAAQADAPAVEPVEKPAGNP